jgi:hypothetical protein
LRKLLPRRAEAFEAGLPGDGEDPLGDNIGLVQLVQVPARDGRGGPTEGESGDPIFGIGVSEREVGAGIAVGLTHNLLPAEADPDAIDPGSCSPQPRQNVLPDEHHACTSPSRQQGESQS